MDDKTRGVGDNDDLTGWSAETTRNLETGPANTSGTLRKGAASRSAGTRRTAGTTGSGGRTDEALDRETDERTREIQAEIAGTRDDMAETIDAIQERLRPGNIASNAADAVKSATTRTVRNVADKAGDTAQDLVDSTRRGASDLVEGTRQNPYPALMIGAGVAWLLIDRKRGDSSTYSRDSGSLPYATPRYGAYEGRPSRYRTNHVAAGTATDLSDFDAPQYGDDEYREGSTTGRVRDRAREASSRASEMADDARHAVRRTTRNAQSGLQRLLRENPLLVGAAAVLVGAAVGAALPVTDRENELMGETRDSMMHQAEDMARDAANTVKEVASDAGKEVTDRLSEGR